MEPNSANAMQVDSAPNLRHGGFIEKSGILIRRSHNPLSSFHRRHRFLVIRGSNLTCFRHQTDQHPEWNLPLQHCQVSGDPERFDIIIRLWNDDVEVFQCNDKAEYDDWYAKLKQASEKTIKDHYSFVRTIGEGHFGRVLLAKDRHTKEKFAVKVIKKNVTEVRSLTLIQRELDILRVVNHTNVVRLHDLFDSNEKLYFVLEYMSGGPLYDVLGSEEWFTEERAAYVVRDILNGLSYLHSQKIVHRDVKPENILTTSKSWPFTSKLADFGLSNFLGGEGLASKVGTPYFCAREVVTNEKYGSKADLWSLGVVTYEMLSGKKPFNGENTRSVLLAIIEGRYDFPRAEWDHISPEARDFVSKLICVDVETRLSAEQALLHPWIVNGGRSQRISNPLAANSNRQRTHANDSGDEGAVTDE